MRAVATLTTLLLLLAPLALAQDGSSGDGSSSSSSSSQSSTEGPSPEPSSDGNSTSSEPTRSAPSPEACPMPDREPRTDKERQACLERHCREAPDDVRCQRDKPAEASGAPDGWARWCKDEASQDSARGRCRQALADFDGRDGRWISFKVDAANVTLLDYRVDGALVAEAIHLDTGSGNLTVQSMGSALRLGDEDTDLTVHDDPTGLLRFKGADGWVSITLPADAKVQHTEDGSLARIELASGRVFHLNAGNATFLDDHTIVASGFLALLGPPAKGHDEKDGHDEQVKDEVDDAIEHRKVGAEISVNRPSPASHASIKGGEAGPENGTVEVLAYDDLEVKVRLPSGDKATPDAPIRVELSADLTEGRTIVLNVNRSLLESGDPQSLVLRYFDLHDQADGSTLETEVVFQQAASLQDVLDPSDDSGQPEYWVVQDANGLQVMASVPHWSAHAITVGSLARLATTPSVVTGIVAGVAGSVIAAVAMLWPRRQDE